MTPNDHIPDPIIDVCIGHYRNRARQATLFTDRPLNLETGVALGPIEVAYETWGTPSPTLDNAVLIVHALTGDSHAAAHSEDDAPGWFEGVVGKGCALDPKRDYIVCANWLGSNYGTTGPASINKETGKPWGKTFPSITIGDMSRVLKALSDHLGISKWRAVIGGSVGGMVTLDFISRFPGLVAAAIPMATAFRASPWVIAFHSIMRRIISLGIDSNDEELLRRSLEAARMVGIVTYRSRQEFVNRYHRVRAELTWQDKGCTFAVESYLSHQGKKLDERFDPITYTYLTQAADMFDLGETHGNLDMAVSRVRCPVTVVGIDTDYLFPLSDQEEIRDAMAEGNTEVTMETIMSAHGHDGFLIEFEQLNRIIGDFLSRQ